MAEQHRWLEAWNSFFSVNYTSLLRLFSNTDCTVLCSNEAIRWWFWNYSPSFNNVQEIRGSPWYRDFCGCSVCVMLRWTYKCMEEESIKWYLSGKFPPTYEIPERQILVPTKVFREILLTVYSVVCAGLDVWFSTLLKAGIWPDPCGGSCSVMVLKACYLI